MKPAIRVVLPADETSTETLNLIECLRYCGAIKTIDNDLDNTIAFDVPVGTKVFAEMATGKWKSHGFNAVAAPRI